jgi:hypothetical protein
LALPGTVSTSQPHRTDAATTIGIARPSRPDGVETRSPWVGIRLLGGNILRWDKLHSRMRATILGINSIDHAKRVPAVRWSRTR